MLPIRSFAPSVVYAFSTVCSKTSCPPALWNARPRLFGSSDGQLSRPTWLWIVRPYFLSSKVYPVSEGYQVWDWEYHLVWTAWTWLASMAYSTYILVCLSIRSPTFIDVSAPDLNIGGQGSYLWLLMLTLYPLPIRQFDPSTMRSLAANKLCHTREGFGPISASKKEHGEKYLALYTL